MVTLFGYREAESAKQRLPSPSHFIGEFGFAMTESLLKATDGLGL